MSDQTLSKEEFSKIAELLLTGKWREDEDNHINESVKSIKIDECVDEPATMGDILLEAHKIVNGDRQGLYGTPENNFQCIADYWERYLKHTKQAYLVMYPEDVAMMMVLMKIARLESGHFTKDSCVDAAGYMAWYSELAPKLA